MLYLVYPFWYAYIKNMIDEDPFYNTKILIFSFTWAGLAAFHKSSTNEGCSKLNYLLEVV